MPRNATPPSVRIMPMSDKVPGFRGKTVEAVQRDFFRRAFPASGGRWRYPRSGLAAPIGTVVLFQFKARVIASAVLLRDEKFDRPQSGQAGALHFDPQTIRTFAPVDAAAMRKAWPAFRAFGHVKQSLHPGRYAAFARRLKDHPSE